MSDSISYIAFGVVTIFFVYKLLTSQFKKVENQVSAALGIGKHVVRRMTSNIVKHQTQIFYKYVTVDFAARLIFINEMLADPNPARMGVLAGQFKSKGFDPAFSEHELSEGLMYFNIQGNVAEIKKFYKELISNEDFLKSKESNS